jgi:predicted transcriptional regulator
MKQLTNDLDGFDAQQYLSLTIRITCAYVSANAVPLHDLPDLIRAVHTAIAASGQDQDIEELTPTVLMRESITPAYLICLEDKKRFRALKRHLRSVHGLTPEEYRQKWRLPSDYPMTAPNHSRRRSELAKKIGLGRSGRKPRRKRLRN